MRSSLPLFTAVAVCVIAANFVVAESPGKLHEQVRAYRVAHEEEIIGEFVRLLSVPNHASDSQISSAMPP
jgi:hypothetical protein